MKKLNNKIKILLILITILVSSFLVEIFIFHFRFFSLESGEKGIISINDYELNVNDDKKEIRVLLNGTYVSKLKIEYDVEKDVPISIDFIEKNCYNSPKNNKLYDVFDNEVHEQIMNYNNNIQEITISYDKDYSVEIKKILVDNQLYISWLRLLFLSVTFSCFVLFYYFYKYKIDTNKIYKFFFIIGLIIGTTMIVLEPAATYYSWDDQIHFSNVYGLRGGNLTWKVGEFNMIDGNAIGRNSINSFEEQTNQIRYLNQNKQSEYSNYGGRLIAYNEVAYIPSAIGFYLCRFLKFPFSICFKAGKVFNLLAYLLIMAYAIKISKVSKRLLTVIALAPGNVFLACHYSYDPAVISGFTLGVVCLFNWFTDKDYKMNFKNFSVFVFSMLYGCFSKAVYIPFILLFLFIPKDRFRSKKQSIQMKAGVFILCLVIMATFVLPTVTNSAVADARGGDTSISRQLAVILGHPFGYVQVLKDTMIAQFMSGFFGGGLSSYAYIGNVSNNLHLWYLFLLLFVFATDTNRKQMRFSNRLVSFIILLGVVLLIWTALYLSFTPVGETSIGGVQPRYFLPLLFPLLICFQTNKIKNDIPYSIYNTLVLAIPAIILLCSIYQLIVVKFCI